MANILASEKLLSSDSEDGDYVPLEIQGSTSEPKEEDGREPKPCLPPFDEDWLNRGDMGGVIRTETDIPSLDIITIWHSFLLDPSVEQCRKLIGKCCKVTEFTEDQIKGFCFFFTKHLRYVIELYNDDNKIGTYVFPAAVIEVKGIPCVVDFSLTNFSNCSCQKKKILEVKVHPQFNDNRTLYKEVRLLSTYQDYISYTIDLFCTAVSLINNGVYNTLSHRLTTPEDYEKDLAVVTHFNMLFKNPYYGDCCVCSELTSKKYCGQCNNKLCEICYMKIPLSHNETVGGIVVSCPTCRNPLSDDEADEDDEDENWIVDEEVEEEDH